MAKHILNASIAFLAGIIGFGVLFLILKFVAKTTGLTILEFSPFFSKHYTQALFNGLYEELGKFLSIKSYKIENPDSIFLGLGWSGMEAFIRHNTRGNINSLSVRITPTILQIITAMIICYFIKRKKPVFGLLAAIIFHTGYDFIFCEYE